MGSGEILVIALIALVVLGPEKLPKLAADIGRWVGRARAMARQLRSQLDQEVHLEELRRLERTAAEGVEAVVRPTPPPPQTPDFPPKPAATTSEPPPPEPPVAPPAEAAAPTTAAAEVITHRPPDGQP